jgi:hypothetical protein
VEGTEREVSPWKRQPPRWQKDEPQYAGTPIERLHQLYQKAIIETEAGSVDVEAEVTGSSCRGQVVVPHGFGLIHGGKSHGANVNRLAPAKHRDRFAATPIHRFIPCRVRKA